MIEKKPLFWRRHFICMVWVFQWKSPPVWDPRITLVDRDFKKSLLQPSAPNRVHHKVRLGLLSFYLVQSWKPPRSLNGQSVLIEEAVFFTSHRTGSAALKHVSCTPQFGVICKLGQRVLCCLLKVIDRDFKQQRHPGRISPFNHCPLSLLNHHISTYLLVCPSRP